MDITLIGLLRIWMVHIITCYIGRDRKGKSAVGSSRILLKNAMEYTQGWHQWVPIQHRIRLPQCLHNANGGVAAGISFCGKLDIAFEEYWNAGEKNLQTVNSGFTFRMWLGSEFHTLTVNVLKLIFLWTYSNRGRTRVDAIVNSGGCMLMDWTWAALNKIWHLSTTRFLPWLVGYLTNEAEGVAYQKVCYALRQGYVLSNAMLVFRFLLSFIWRKFRNHSKKLRLKPLWKRTLHRGRNHKKNLATWQIRLPYSKWRVL